MWVRFLDNMNPYWRQCYGERRFQTLNEAMSYGTPTTFEKLNGNAYISKPINSMGTRVRILREP